MGNWEWGVGNGELGVGNWELSTLHSSLLIYNMDKKRLRIRKTTSRARPLTPQEWEAALEMYSLNQEEYQVKLTPLEVADECWLLGECWLDDDYNQYTEDPHTEDSRGEDSRGAHQHGEDSRVEDSGRPSFFPVNVSVYDVRQQEYLADGSWDNLGVEVPAGEKFDTGKLSLVPKGVRVEDGRKEIRIFVEARYDRESIGNWEVRIENVGTAEVLVGRD